MREWELAPMIRNSRRAGMAVNAFIVTFGMVLPFGLVGALGLVSGFATLPSPAEPLLGPTSSPASFVLFPSPTPTVRAAAARTPIPTPTPASASRSDTISTALALVRLFVFGSFFLAPWPTGLAGYLTYSHLSQP
jgi:hypothetical protein